MIDLITFALAKKHAESLALGGATPIPGPPGRDGENAYQLAVRQGFSGTLDDWLTSLQANVQSMSNHEIQSILDNL